MVAYLNRCIWIAASGGTGSFVVSAAVLNGYAPASCASPAVVNAATYHYLAIDAATGAHEEGDGAWTTATSTLTRATIRNSSNAGAAVSFVNPPTVFMGGPVGNDMPGQGELDLIAGTTTVAPLKFASGTNLATPAAGACEFDGVAFYETSVASARQLVQTQQVLIQNATRTFTANTSAQAVFNASTSGAVTLQSATTYQFEMMIAASGFSSSTWSETFGFGGTATLTSIQYFYDCQGGSTLAGPSTALSGFVATASQTTVLSAVTTTGLVLRVRGTVRINAGGTFIPQVAQVTNTAAAVLQIGSFFRIWPIGANAVATVGNWS